MLATPTSACGKPTAPFSAVTPKNRTLRSMSPIVATSPWAMAANVGSVICRARIGELISSACISRTRASLAYSSWLASIVGTSTRNCSARERASATRSGLRLVARSSAEFS